MKRNLALVVTGCLGLLAFLLLLDSFFPYKAANLEIGKEEAMEIASDFLTQRGYDLTDYDAQTLTRLDVSAFVYLQERYGLEKAEELFKKEKNIGLDFYWRIIWYKNLPKNTEYEQYSVSVSGNGEIIAFNHDVPVNADWPEKRNPHITQEEALTLAQHFLDAQGIHLEGYKQQLFNTEKHDKRTDHSFNWVKEFKSGGVKTHLAVVVQGDEVGKFNSRFGIPEDRSIIINGESGDKSVAFTVSFIFAFIFCLAILAIFLKKYHEGEVGVKSAVTVFLVTWIFLVLESGLKFSINSFDVSMGNVGYNTMALVVFLFLSLILWPFFSIMNFASWSVGEALGRERFSEKFTAFDSVLNRQFSTLNVARSFLNGYFAGFSGLGLLAGLTYLFLHGLGGRIDLSGYNKLMPSIFPFLVPVLAAVSTALLSEMVFRLFSNLVLYKYLKSKWGAVFVSSFFWVLYAVSSWGANISLRPLYLEWILWYVFGLFFGYLFWKFDLLTIIVANFLVVGVMQTLPLITSGTGAFFHQGVISLVLLFLPVVFIVRGFIKGELFAVKADLMPAHIKRITERARMAKELEIARQVQMRLLPEKSPDIANVDIEGVCIPANEVGGDYYDFIPIDDSRLAIVIGDVSGKGVPAAIYMTLTKGIIQTQAENKHTPEEVLTRVNRSLYSMMDHKSFVTLYYAVIDVEGRRLDYCRAGHNPMLLFRERDNEVISLKPRGIALGIEKGILFNSIITEGHIELKRGDLLAFYTDGFSEAMNKEDAEYGEERLSEILRDNKDLPLKKLIDVVLRDVRSFTRGAPQHDDMTMVLVRMS